MAHQGNRAQATTPSPPADPLPAAAGASRSSTGRRSTTPDLSHRNTPRTNWRPARPASPTSRWLPSAATGPAPAPDGSAPQPAGRQTSSLRDEALRTRQDRDNIPTTTIAATAAVVAAAFEHHQQNPSLDSPHTTVEVLHVRLYNLPQDSSARELASFLQGPPEIISWNLYVNHAHPTLFEAEIIVRSRRDADHVCDTLEDSFGPERLAGSHINAQLLAHRSILPTDDAGSGQHPPAPLSSSLPASSSVPASTSHSPPAAFPSGNVTLPPRLGGMRLLSEATAPALSPRAPVGFSAASTTGPRTLNPARLAADHGRNAGRLLLTEQQADDADDTDYLLNNLASFPMQTDPPPQRRATEPQIPIGPMASLSLNISTGAAGPPRSSSSRQLTHPVPASARAPPSSSFFGSAPPRHGFPPRHQYPPMNPSDQNPPCNTLYVGNLPHDTSEDELKTLFGTQRGFKRLCLRAKHNGPMCFVEFETISYATKTLSELYGHPLHNSVKGGIRLSFSKNPLGVRSGQLPGQAPSSLSSHPHAGHMPFGPGGANGFTAAQGPPPGLTAPPGLCAARPPPAAAPAAAVPDRRPWDDLLPVGAVTEAGTYAQRAPELWRPPNQLWNHPVRPMPATALARPTEGPPPPAAPSSHPPDAQVGTPRPAGLSDGSQALPPFPRPAPISYWSSAYATAARNGNYGPIGPAARNAANARNQQTANNPPNGIRVPNETDGLGGANAPAGAPSGPSRPPSGQYRHPADRRNGLRYLAPHEDDWESVESGEGANSNLDSDDLYYNDNANRSQGRWGPP